MSNDIIHDHRSIRADQAGWTHRVDLRWFEYPDGTVADPETHHALLTIEQAEDLIVSLQQAIRLTRDRQLAAARRGECATCRGVRMVSKEVHGRIVHSHSRCPDCPPADVWEGPLPPELRSALEVTD